MQNLTIIELTQISESYHGGLQGIEKDLTDLLNSDNLDNLIPKRTKHLARIDLITVKSMLRGDNYGGN